MSEFRKFYYFIENEDSKWHYVRKEVVNRSGIVHDDVIELHNDWTIDPLVAARFDSVEDAEKYMTLFSFKREDSFAITEHEFVVSKVKEKELLPCGEISCINIHESAYRGCDKCKYRKRNPK